MVCDEVTLEAHTKEQWSIVTDVNKGPVEVADLLEALKFLMRCGKRFLLMLRPDQLT